MVLCPTTRTGIGGPIGGRADELPRTLRSNVVFPDRFAAERRIHRRSFELTRAQRDSPPSLIDALEAAAGAKDWWGPRSNLFGAGFRGARGGTARVFRYNEPVVDFSNPRRGRGEPGPYKSDNSKYARPGRRPLTIVSRGPRSRRSFFDAALFSRA